MPYFGHQISDAPHSQTASPEIGVLLCNLGSPAAPTARAVRRYLREFLSDPRIVELPRPLWWLILNGIILNVRPRRSAHAYKKIWTPHGSPLLHISAHQVRKLQARLDMELQAPLQVRLAMRYGTPAISPTLREMARDGMRKLLVLPLYPQYSGATVGSTLDAVTQELREWRWVPECRTVNAYHDEPAYIEALANSVREHWSQHGRGERLLMSFHGIPRAYVEKGDPYASHCETTATQLAQALDLTTDDWVLCYQSRFGREEWLQPYTSEILRTLGTRGHKQLDVICPGFAADCLETLEEIQLQNAQILRAAGGELRYITALNERDDHIDFLVALLRRHLAGWLTAPGGSTGSYSP